MRICIIYDCLFPWTIGGAERWYRNLAERLAAAGHEVTYVTLTQWEDSNPPAIAGVRVVAVGARMPLYDNGKRRIIPPLRFGFGVFWHLLRRGRSYDWVHTASFPYFSLLAAGALRRLCGYRIAVDWHEVWSRQYWREYLGAAGAVGWAVQRLCARVPHEPYAFSRLHAARLQGIGVRARPTILTGEYDGPPSHCAKTAAAPATIVYAGRFIREKRLPLLVKALQLVMLNKPEVRAILYGDGPDHERVREQVEVSGLSHRILLPGFVDGEEIDGAITTAVVVVQPSRREGYGMIVVEASAKGVPAVVVAAEDNAATELIEDGENGFVVAEADETQLAQAIVKCVDGGPELRERTRHWYACNRERLSLSYSLSQVVARYAMAASTAKLSSVSSTAILERSGVA